MELKRSIPEKIDSINDRELLEAINALLDNHAKVFHIPEHMKEGIRKGKEDIKKGNFSTIKEFEKK